ncbi:MAG: CBS domain-containing protein [Candidatus Undinarchaeales archaeon]
MRVEDIKRLRMKLGLTQSKLSKISGVSQSAIAKIEAGKMSPTYEKAKKIFDALENYESRESIQAKDILTEKVHTINSSDSVEKAVSLMKKHNISQLPVLEKGHLVGLISENSLVERLGDENLGKEKVKNVMSEAPPTVSANAPLKLIREILKHSPIVLVYKKEKMLGLIAKSDLLKTVR